jgi:hypothetical protein
MTQLKDGGRQSSNREERSLSASTVIARWQGNGWDEPCKSRGLRTVLWAAGGEIPPADPAAWNPYLDALSMAMQHRSREQPLRDYCTGLLLPDGRKSVEPIAARIAPSGTRTMHKKLLNFVSDGAWSDEAVLAAMRRQVMPALDAHGAVRHWIVDETGMAKKSLPPT